MVNLERLHFLETDIYVSDTDHVFPSLVLVFVVGWLLLVVVGYCHCRCLCCLLCGLFGYCCCETFFADGALSLPSSLLLSFFVVEVGLFGPLLSLLG